MREYLSEEWLFTFEEGTYKVCRTKSGAERKVGSKACVCNFTLFKLKDLKWEDVSLIHGLFSHAQFALSLINSNSPSTSRLQSSI